MVNKAGRGRSSCASQGLQFEDVGILSVSGAGQRRRAQPVAIPHQTGVQRERCGTRWGATRFRYSSIASLALVTGSGPTGRLLVWASRRGPGPLARLSARSKVDGGVPGNRVGKRIRSEGRKTGIRRRGASLPGKPSRLVRPPEGAHSTRGTFFFVNSLNVLESLTLQWLSVALRILMNPAISNVKCQQATG